MAKKKTPKRKAVKKKTVKRKPAKKLKIKKKSGSLIDYPENTVRKVLSTAGFTGKALMSASTGVFKEATKLAKAGVVSVTDVEKAVVRSVANTNKIVMNTAKKVTKKVLR